MRTDPRALIITLVLLGTIPSFGACSSSEEPTPSAPSSTARGGGEAPTSLIYLDDRDIVGLDLASEEETVLGRVPAPDVYPVPHQPDRFLLVEDRSAGEDFAADPMLSLIDQQGQVETSFGPGFSPLVDPSGERVAYLRSVGARECEGEVCLAQVEVRTAELGGGRPRTVLPAGDWYPLSWAGEDLVVSAVGEAFILSPDGDREKLGISPDEIWGVTPDGSQLLISSRSGIELMDLETLERRSLPLNGLLAEGEWSPEGDELVVVVVQGAKTRLARLSPADPEVEEIPDSSGASGPVLWGPEGTFLYVRADGLDLEAVLCEQGAECRPVLRWAEGITPLAVE